MKLVAATFALAMVLALPAMVHGWASETFGNAPVAEQPDWAVGVVDVVNLKSRVYSQWVNGNENFFYRGDRQALKEALQRFAAIKDDEHQLILLPGSGKTQTFARKPITFDWQLHVPSGIYKTASKRKHMVLTVYIDVAKPRPLERKQAENWLRDLDSQLFATRQNAEKELKKLGNDAKLFLRAALKTQPSEEARRRIEGLLNRLPYFDVTDLEIPKGITVTSVDDLLAVHMKGLRDEDSTVRGMAIQELSSLVPYSDKVVPAVTDVLKNDKNTWVRRVAAASLAAVCIKSKSALPILKQGLEDPDAYVRHTFQNAFDEIEKDKGKPGQDDEVRRRVSILKEIIEFKKAAGGGN
jgi:hypothetical protein